MCFWPRSRSSFHFCKRGRESRAERCYRDLRNSICSDCATTLDMDQHIPCICGMARGRFGARSCPLDRMVGIRSQPRCLRTLSLNRRAISPRTHATDDTPLVRLRDTGEYGGFAGRLGIDFKFPNWSGGKRRACGVPCHLYEHHGHPALSHRRSRHGGGASERRSRPCGIWRSVADTASHSSAARVRRGPRWRPRRLRRLECRCLCDTAPSSHRLSISPTGVIE